MSTVRIRPGSPIKPAPEQAWTGQLRVVCDRCGVAMGSKACLPANDGKVSHSKCPACVAAFLRELEAVPAGARELRADEVARVCGVAVERLGVLCPRRVAWGVEALTDLVGLLAVSGEGAASARLMAWLVSEAGNFTAGCGAPESVAVKRAALRTSTVPARELSGRRGWWHRWEGEHS